MHDSPPADDTGARALVIIVLIAAAIVVLIAVVTIVTTLRLNPARPPVTPAAPIPAPAANSEQAVVDPRSEAAAAVSEPAPPPYTGSEAIDRHIRTAATSRTVAACTRPRVAWTVIDSRDRAAWEAPISRPGLAYLLAEGDARSPLFALP